MHQMQSAPSVAAKTITTRYAKRLHCIAALLLVSVSIAACSGPSVSGDLLFGHGLIIHNTGDASFTVTRLIANDSPENSSCNNYPNTTMAAGQSYTAVFLGCGTIQKLEVVTDADTSFISFN